MASKLEAIFALVDRASGPGKAIVSALKNVDEAASKVGKKASGAWDSIKSGAESLKPAVQAVGEVLGYVADKVKILAIAGAALITLAAKEAIEATEFKEQSLKKLQILEGTQQGAEAAYAAIRKMADATGQANDVIFAMYTSFRKLGFSAQDALDLVAASLDVKAVGGDEAAAGLQRLFEKIKTSGEFKFDPREFLQAGLTKDEVAKQIQTFVQYKNMSLAQIEKLMDEGKIQADIGMKAILQTVNENIDKGAGLGSAGQGILGNSLAGQWQALKNALLDLVSNVDLSPLVNLIKQFQEALKSPEALAAIADFKQAFTDLGPAFKQIFTPGNVHALIKMAEGFFQIAKAVGGGVVKALLAFFGPLRDIINLSDDSSGGWAKTIHGFELLGSAIGSVIAILGYGIGAVVFLIAWIFEIIYEIGQAIGNFFANTLPGWVSGGWNAIKNAFQAVIDWFAGLPATFANLGQAIIDALTGTLTNGAKLPADAMKAVGEGLTTAYKQAMKISSPSKVMMELGEQTIAGLNMPIDAGMNDNALAGGLDVPTASPIGSFQGGKGGGKSEVHIHVTVPAHPGMTTGQATAIGQAIGKGIRDELADEAELLAMAVGQT